jgi:hypothetical protein
MEQFFLFLILLVIMFVLLEFIFNKKSKYNQQITTKGHTMDTNNVEFCHVYVVKDFEDGEIHIFPRQEREIVETFNGVVREGTIAYNAEFASLAICNPHVDKQTGIVDNFSRYIGRAIAEERLNKMMMAVPTAADARPTMIVAQPKLHDFLRRSVRQAVNAYLTELRKENAKPRIQKEVLTS